MLLVWEGRTLPGKLTMFSIADMMFDCDHEAEDREYELGAEIGDPRRCPRHPHVATSSPDGMFDTPCGECEFASEEAWAKEEDAKDAARYPGGRCAYDNDSRTCETRDDDICF